LAKKKLVETTLYSLSATAPECPDRRSDERYVSLLRVGALTLDRRRELCLIRNVSAGGMMIRPYSPIAAGTHLTVELKQGDSVSGVVQWSDKGLVGITFDEPIDVLALFRATVANISQGGICVHSPVDLEVACDVVVSLAGLHSAAGVVKWRDGDYYGIGFNRVYPVDELMGFLQDQQREEQQRRAVA
jgi:hypothetical protein